MAYTAKAYFKHGHGDNPVQLTTADDVDRLLDDLLAEPWENSVAAVYIDNRLNQAGVPDHELLVAIDHKDKDAGSLRYMGEDGVYFSQGEGADDETVLFYYMGGDREFPRGAALPIADIRAAITDFLATGGGRPDAVEWHSMPDDD